MNADDLAQGLLSREPWCCATCVPTLGVAMTRDAWTVTVAHQPGCGSFAEWLVTGAGIGAPSSTGSTNPHDPTTRGDDT